MRDPIVESHLDDRLVKWTYLEQVPLSAVNEKLSLKNQARFEPLHEEVVARYTEAVERGDKFPALVGARTRNEDIVLIDGNHRYQAHKRGKIETIDVYVVAANAETLQLLCFESNAKHGEPPSTEERIRHAIYLIDNGATQKSAAASVGLLESTVQNTWNAERADRRARSLGVTRGWGKLTREQRLGLAGITSDTGFVEATHLVVDGRLSTMDTRRLCTELRKIRSDSQQVAHIADTRDMFKTMNTGDNGKPTFKMDARRGLIPHLGYLAQMDIEAVVNATITDHHREDLTHRLEESRAMIDLLQEAVEKRAAEVLAE